ncbi:Ger(x)C family spore germination protein [Tumebacillus lipolyticus]|uniref:Ger(X)C family spore germination protein n=1 Tax=Tumebacillus lipolyticus TaxID=1280370 RepID=A0ABW4ZY36_9BACL
MKRLKKLLSLVLVLCLSSLLISGCWDRRELEERTSVVAMAIDLADGREGLQPLIKLSVQIPIPIKITASGGGGGQGGKSAVKVMSSTGYSLADAMRNLQQRLNQELFYGHTRVVAISEKMAKQGLEDVLDSIRRSPQMRRLLWILITPDQAVDLLETDPKLEQIPIVYVMDLIENGAKAGTVPDISLGKWFIDRSSSGIEGTANFVVTDKKEVKWHGLALFQQDKMVGTLDEKDAWVLMQIRDGAIGGEISIPCPEKQNLESGTRKYITAHPKKVHTKSTVEPWGGSFRMSVQVLLELDLIESMCHLDYREKETIQKIEKAFSAELNRRAKKLVDKCIHTYGVDVFGMGNKVRAKYIERFDPANWNKDFTHMSIDVVYQVEIRRVGMKTT